MVQKNKTVKETEKLKEEKMAQENTKNSSDSKSINKELRINYIDISLLKKYKRNAKIHTKKQIAKLVQSMQTFGVVTAIIIDKNYEVMAGHGRLEALKQLGYTKVPVIMLEHLTKAQVRAYRLADNRIADEAEYDADILKIELQELVLSDEIVITDTGYDIAEVDGLVIEGYGKIQEKPDKDDEIENPSKIETRTKFGDLWQLEEHLLFCCDSLKSHSYQTLMGKDKAALVLTDMPYNQSSSYIGGKGKIKHENFAMASGEMSDGEFFNFIDTFMCHLKNFSVDGALFLLFIDWRGLNIVLNAGIKNNLELKNIICWHKTTGGMGSLWRSAHELIPVFKHGTGHHQNNVELGKHGRYRTNVWEHKGISATNPKSLELLKLHPTVKPIGLLHEALLDVSCAGDIILDCFGGSGSTLLACERAKRRARLIEISPRYTDISIFRWEQLTGKKAVLLGNYKEVNHG